MMTARKRHRSPEHPGFDLRTAIERAKVFYQAEHYHQVDVASALARWGYGPTSGTGLRTVAALIHFGLVEDEGAGKDRLVRLSDLAMKIVVDGSPDRSSAIREAALKPRIYVELWEHIGGKGPLPSDESLHYTLVQMGFNPKAIPKFISDFRSTLEFSKLLKEDLGVREGADEQTTAEASDVEVAAEQSGSRVSERKPASTVQHQDQEILDLTIPLIGGGTVVVSTPIPLSNENHEIVSTFWKTFRRSLTYPLRRDEDRDGGESAGAQRNMAGDPEARSAE